MKRWIAAALIGASVLAAPAYAQVNSDMVVVTGSMIRSEEDEYGDPLPELPYVSIAVPADFVLFTVALETGTRAFGERQSELERTFAALSARATRAQGVTMEVGHPGYSAPLETAAAREAIEYDGERSTIHVVLKFAVRPGDTFVAVRERAETFIDEIDVFGRAEAVAGDLQYIGVSEPKKHREDLLRRIAEDTRLLQSIFGAPAGAPTISLTGLGGRVKTRPIGPLEMEMYIPYSIVLGSG